MIDSCWEGTFSREMRRQAAGVESLGPRGLPPPLPPFLAEGPVQGPRNDHRKPALSVGPSYVKAKSQMVLWHVVGRVSDKHMDIEMSSGKVCKNKLVVHWSVCAAHLHETHEQSGIHSITDTLNLPFSLNGAVCSKRWDVEGMISGEHAGLACLSPPFLSINC